MARRPIILPLIACALALALQARAGVELHCTELGSGCKASELFDFDSGVDAIDNGYDLPGTQPLTINTSSNDQETVSSSGLGLPSGATVARVLRVQLYDNFTILGTANRSFTNSTYCSRHYFRHTNFGAYDLEGFKSARYHGPDDFTHDSPGTQTHWDDASDTLRMAFGEYGTLFGNPPGGPDTPSGGTTVTETDCSNNWCRLEMCMDHNAPGQPSNSLHYRSRLIDTSNGHTMTWTNTGPNANATANCGDTCAHFKTFWETPPSFGSSDYVYVSALIETLVSADTGFWPGPASEIEGGGGETTMKAHVLRP